MTKLSFVIPTYNCVTWLPHAVTSCLAQTEKDIEVVIVNDGSTDRTEEYLGWLEKQESRVKVMRPGKNLGRSEARNLGNSYVQSEYIAVLDADDLATPNRAELTLRKFKTGGLDYIYGGATVIDSLGRETHRVSADVFDSEKAVKEMQNRIVHSTAAYTRAFSEKYPYRSGELAKLGLDDWAQQIEAKLAGAAFDFIPQRLAAHRILNSQITKTRDEAAVLAAKKSFLDSLKVTA